mgnify:CR=1 FL=1
MCASPLVVGVYRGRRVLVTGHTGFKGGWLSLWLAELGAGRVMLNTSADEAFFKKEASFTPYALTDGSALITAFIRQVGEE